jgi:hypothetical protein
MCTTSCPAGTWTPKARTAEMHSGIMRGLYDIGNLHEYADWNIFRTQPDAVEEERTLRGFRAAMDRHGEAGKSFWVTEIGWWGTGSMSNKYEVYRKDPESGIGFKPVCVPCVTWIQ